MIILLTIVIGLLMGAALAMHSTIERLKLLNKHIIELAQIQTVFITGLLSKHVASQEKYKLQELLDKINKEYR